MILRFFKSVLSSKSQEMENTWDYIKMYSFISQFSGRYYRQINANNLSIVVTLDW